MLTRWIVKGLALLALVVVVPVMAQEEEGPVAGLESVYAAQQAAGKYIRAHYNDPDADELGKVLAGLEKAVTDIVSDKKSSQKQVAEAYQQLLYVYSFAARVKSDRFRPAMEKWLVEIKEKAPKSKALRYGEFVLLDLETRASEPTPALKAKIIDYARNQANELRDVGTVMSSFLRKVAAKDTTEAVAIAKEFLTVVEVDEVNLMISQIKNIGTPAKFSLKSTKGEKINEATYKGKVVVIDVWATWCGPCVQMTPGLAKLHAKYAGKLEIVGLNVDEEVGALDGYLAKKKEVVWPQVAIPYDSAEQRKAFADLSLPNGTPALLVIDQKGQYASVITNELGVIEESVERLLKK